MKRLRVALAAAALGVVLTACGSGSSGTAKSAAVEVPKANENFTLPATEVTDVGAGTTTVFADIAPSDRPVLLWFWAPH